MSPLLEAPDARACVLLLPGAWPLDERIGMLRDEGLSVALLRWWEGSDPARVADGEVLRRVIEARGELPADLPRLLLGVGEGGGHARLAACAVPGFAGIVEFYGPLVYTAVGPLRPAQPLDLLPGLGCPYLGHFGEQDTTSPAHHVAELQRRLGFVTQPSQVLSYPGVGRGFAERGSPGFDAAAADLAWQRTLRFLDHLAG